MHHQDNFKTYETKRLILTQEEIGKYTLRREDFTHFSQKPSEGLELLLKSGYRRVE